MSYPAQAKGLVNMNTNNLHGVVLFQVFLFNSNNYNEIL